MRGRKLWISLLSCATACTGVDEAARATPQWQLVEEVVVGSLDGASGQHVFGNVDELVGTPDGGVIVADVQAVEVTRFGPDGERLFRYGARGQGPGEYEDLSGLAIMPDGSVLVRDPRRGLIFFNPDGSLRDEWPIRVDFVGDDPVSVVGDTVLLRFIHGPRSLETSWQSPRHAFLRVADGRVLDTVPTEPIRQPDLYWAPYHPRFHRDWLSNGAEVRGAGSEFELQIVTPSSTVVIHLDSVPARVPLSDAAVRYIEEHHAWLEGRGNRSAPFYPDPPTYLPVYERVLTSDAGLVWIERPISETNGAAYQMDVYEADGRKIASLAVPIGVSIRSVGQNWVWGLRKGEYDEQYVVRYRIVAR